MRLSSVRSLQQFPLARTADFGAQLASHRAGAEGADAERRACTAAGSATDVTTLPHGGPSTALLWVARGLVGAALFALSVFLPKASTAAYPPSAQGGSYAASADHAEATRAALDVMAR